MSEPDLGALLGGYAASLALMAGVEVGLFEALADGSPATTAALGARLGASPEGVARLAEALFALGLVARDEEGRWRATPTAQLLAGPVGRLVRYHRRHLVPLALALPEAVRSGQPQLGAWPFAEPGATDAYAALRRQPEEYALFLDAMDLSAAGVGARLAARPELSGARRLVDLGGGGGQIARELVSALPSLSVLLVDTPEAVTVARARNEAMGLGARIETRAGELRALALAPEADAALLAGVLADFAPADQARIVGGAIAALRPGGWLLVAESLLDERGPGPLVPALVSLLLFAGLGGRSLRPRELTSLLATAGLVEVQVIAGGAGTRDLVVGRKPG